LDKNQYIRSLENQKTVSISFADCNVLNKKNLSILKKELYDELGKRKLRPALRIQVVNNLDKFKSEYVTGRTANIVKNDLEKEIYYWLNKLVPGRAIISDFNQSSIDPTIYIKLSCKNNTIILNTRIKQKNPFFKSKNIWKGKSQNIPSWYIRDEPSEPTIRILLIISFYFLVIGDLKSAVSVLKYITPKCLDFIKEQKYFYLFLPETFSSSKNTADALDIAEQLLDMGEFEYSARLASSCIYDYPGSYVQRRRYRNILFECIKNSGNQEERGIYHYNLANSFRSDKNYRKALIHYRLARKDIPDYLNRWYWWRELGSVLFLTNHYKWASNAYENALKCEIPRPLNVDNPEEIILETKIEIRYCYFDALFFAGEYEKSIKEFENYLYKAKKPLHEYFLKLEIAKNIYKNFGIKVQKRNKNKSKEVVNKANSLLDTGYIEEADCLIIESLKNIDFLNIEFWEVMLKVADKKNDIEAFFISQMVLGILCKNPTFLAAATLNNIINSLFPNLIVPLIRCGFELFRYSFMDSTIEVYKTLNIPEKVSAKCFDQIKKTFDLCLNLQLNESL